MPCHTTALLQALNPLHFSLSFHPQICSDNNYVCILYLWFLLIGILNSICCFRTEASYFQLISLLISIFSDSLTKPTTSQPLIPKKIFTFTLSFVQLEVVASSLLPIHILYLMVPDASPFSLYLRFVQVSSQLWNLEERNWDPSLTIAPIKWPLGVSQTGNDL